MIFHPPRAVGLGISGGVALALLAVDVGLLAVLRGNPLSAAGFLSLTLLAASVPAIGWLLYRAGGLLRSRYVISRNAIVVEWGSRRIVLPMGLLDEVRAGSEVEAPLRPRGIVWPGSLVGTGSVEGVGEVEFLAAAEKPALVLLRHADAWLAISPSDPAAFMAALQACRAEGPDEEVAPESVMPAIMRWDLPRDRLALGLIGTGALSALLLVGYLAAIAAQLPPQIALHFDGQGQPDRFGPPTGLLILPAIAGLTWLVNTLGGAWLHRREAERGATYWLLGATLFVQALVWAATIGVLTAGNAPS